MSPLAVCQEDDDEGDVEQRLCELLEGHDCQLRIVRNVVALMQPVLTSTRACVLVCYCVCVCVCVYIYILYICFIKVYIFYILYIYI